MNRPVREGFVVDRQDGGDRQDSGPQQAAAAAAAAAAEEKPKRSTPAPVIEPSPAEAPLAEEEKWPITVKLLYRSIRNNNGEEIREVKLREPRAGDINRNGNPIRINQDNDVIIDERKMTFMISQLTGILPPLIETMDTRDWNSVAYRLRRFFLPDPAAW